MSPPEESDSLRKREKSRSPARISRKSRSRSQDDRDGNDSVSSFNSRSSFSGENSKKKSEIRSGRPRRDRSVDSAASEAGNSSFNSRSSFSSENGKRKSEIRSGRPRRDRSVDSAASEAGNSSFNSRSSFSGENSKRKSEIRSGRPRRDRSADSAASVQSEAGNSSFNSRSSFSGEKRKSEIRPGRRRSRSADCESDAGGGERRAGRRRSRNPSNSGDDCSVVSVDREQNASNNKSDATAAEMSIEINSFQLCDETDNNNDTKKETKLEEETKPRRRGRSRNSRRISSDDDKSVDDRSVDGHGEKSKKDELESFKLGEEEENKRPARRRSRCSIRVSHDEQKNGSGSTKEGEEEKISNPTKASRGRTPPRRLDRRGASTSPLQKGGKCGLGRTLLDMDANGSIRRASSVDNASKRHLYQNLYHQGKSPKKRADNDERSPLRRGESRRGSAALRLDDNHSNENGNTQTRLTTERGGLSSSARGRSSHRGRESRRGRSVDSSNRHLNSLLGGGNNDDNDNEDLFGFGDNNNPEKLKTGKTRDARRRISSNIIGGDRNADLRSRFQKQVGGRHGHLEAKKSSGGGTSHIEGPSSTGHKEESSSSWPEKNKDKNSKADKKELDDDNNDAPKEKERKKSKNNGKDKDSDEKKTKEHEDQPSISEQQQQQQLGSKSKMQKEETEDVTTAVTQDVSSDTDDDDDDSSAEEAKDSFPESSSPFDAMEAFFSQVSNMEGTCSSSITPSQPVIPKPAPVKEQSFSSARTNYKCPEEEKDIALAVSRALAWQQVKNQDAGKSFSLGMRNLFMKKKTSGLGDLGLANGDSMVAPTQTKKFNQHGDEVSLGSTDSDEEEDKFNEIRPRRVY